MPPRNKQGAPKLVKVGLIGEDPHDTDAVRHLLSRRFPEQLSIVTLVKRIKGSQLDSEKYFDLICEEFKDQKPRLLVVIRDLDGPASNTQKQRERKAFFDRINECCNNKAIFLLHVEEIEALLLCDLAPFNKRYKTRVAYKGNPMVQRKPKEWAMEKSNRKYVESDCVALFQKMDLEALEGRCSYYREFMEEFKGRLGLLA